MIERLIAARKRSKLTQDEVAQELGVVRSVIGKIERKERRLDVIELREICNIMDISFVSFIQDLDHAIGQSKRIPQRKK